MIAANDSRPEDGLLGATADEYRFQVAKSYLAICLLARETYDLSKAGVADWIVILLNRPKGRWNDLGLAHAAALAMLDDDLAR